MNIIKTIAVTATFIAPAVLALGRKLGQPCALGVRVLDTFDDSVKYDCFCDLQGGDINVKRGNLQRLKIKGNGLEICDDELLNLAATSDYLMFVDGVINDDSSILEVSEGSVTEFSRKSKHGVVKGDGISGHDSNTRYLKGSHRSLQNRQWELLVVAAGGNDDNLAYRLGPWASDDKLLDDWFLDSASLATQMNECSRGKEMFAPLRLPNVDPAIYGNDGVLSLTLNRTIQGTPLRDLEVIVQNAVTDLLGPLPAENLKIAICVPEQSFIDDPFSVGIAAYAIPNAELSVYRHTYCFRIATQMHEIGHNLGLQHSGDLLDNTTQFPMAPTFGDWTGFMGGKSSEDDHEMCYNAAKTWQLGWRPTVDVAVTTSTTQLMLTSFVDWDNLETTKCIARVITPNVYYFVHYNRQAAENADVWEYGNMVIVTERSTLTDFVNLTSQIVAVLGVGTSYSVTNAGGSGRDLQITASSVGLTSATVDISTRPNGDVSCLLVVGDACVNECCGNLVCRQGLNGKGNPVGSTKCFAASPGSPTATPVSPAPTPSPITPSPNPAGNCLVQNVACGGSTKCCSNLICRQNLNSNGKPVGGFKCLPP